MLQWKNCVSVCTDGAASMMGKSKGFVSKVKQINPDVQITHYFLHREALMAKTLPDELKEVLDTAVKLINFIKASPLYEHRRFLFFCSFANKCVNMAEMYILYALKLKPWLRSNSASVFFIT